jgi:dolichol-phosphate mannosyltransferase
MLISDISVIIPARNEEANLQILVPSIIAEYNKYIHEVIIIDDCSTDKTYSVSTSLKKKYHKIKIIKRTINPGVGNALKEGIKNLSPLSKYVLMMDCDFIANLNDIKKFIKHADNYDGVIGSRFIQKDSLNNYPLPKLIANRSYYLLTKILFGVRNTDLTNNFKLFSKDLIDQIYPLLSSNDFAINAETGYFPLILGKKIKEVPVRWKERTSQMGLSKFKILKVGPSYFRVLLKLIHMKFLQNLPIDV